MDHEAFGRDPLAYGTQFLEVTSQALVRRPAQRCGHRSVDTVDDTVERQESGRVSPSEEFVRDVHLWPPGEYQNSLYSHIRAFRRDVSVKDAFDRSIEGRRQGARWERRTNGRKEVLMG
ncbi:hypothetical protein [Streptomyces sp. NPDC092129]|uniref:hypothetical protein n=1 Tax=Streptomyces sp. NPDC092129 TaxID=3366010 RepID=UPI0038103FCA